MNRTARIHDDPIAYPENLRPVEGEMMMLAMLLNDNSRVDIVADLLRSDDFYEPLFGRLYGRIVQLVSAGQQANPFTVNALFANDPAYAEMNAREMLVDLTGTEARASLLIRAVDQATVIAEAAARRRLISVTRELEQRAADADVSVPQLVDETDAALIAATERRDPSRLSDFKSAIGLALTRIERIKANEGKVGKSVGWRTGEALELEIAHHVVNRITRLADQILGWDDAILKHQFSSVRSSHTEFIHDLLSGLVTGHPFFDDEGGYLRASTVACTCSRIQPNDVCRRPIFIDDAVGDPHLSSIDTPIAITL